MILRQTNQIRGGFRERFAYFKHAKDRRENLSSLKEWNLNLDRVISQVLRTKGTPSHISEAVPLGPAVAMSSLEEGREMLKALAKAARDSWKCSCSLRHDAMFCLDHKALSYDRSDRGFDFLVQSSPSDSQMERWYEG